MNSKKIIVAVLMLFSTVIIADNFFPQTETAGLSTKCKKNPKLAACKNLNKK